MGPPTRLAALQSYKAIKNKNGDIYLLKDKGEEGTTTEEGESKKTTETTTESEKEGKKGPSAERVIAALKGKLRERKRRRNRDRYLYY